MARPPDFHEHVDRRPHVHGPCLLHSLFRDSILYPTAITVGEQSRTFLDVLNRIILDQIHMDRDGDYIDKSLIKANTYMLEGLFETDQEGEDEKLYLTKFEQNFLAKKRRILPRREC